MMKIKKIHKIRLINITLWSILLGLCFYDAFIADTESSFSKGQLQGGLIGLAIILLVILPVATVIFTLKSGQGRRKVYENLKHNYVILVSVEWWKSK